MKSKNKYIFCYGTLMSYNPHSIMHDLGATKIDTVLIDDYQLYLNFGNFLFPAIVKGKGKGKQLFAEVWEVHPTLIPYIDRYERVDSGLYTRDEITAGKYKGFIYRMNRVTKGMIPISSNNWTEFLNSVGDKLQREYQRAFTTVDHLGVILEDTKIKGKIRDKYTDMYNLAADEYWDMCDKIKQSC